MTWVRLIGVMPLILGGAVCAQSPNEKVTPLESCFRSSRLADAICMKQNDPAQRLDCLHKTSAAQLECLEHALPEPATASENSSGTVPSGPPANAASSEAPSQSASPKEPGRTEAPEVSTGSIPAKEADSPPKTDLKTNPASDDVTGAIRLDAPGKIADVPTLPAQTNWIVSETTSPLKYRTLVTAVIHATPVVENGPNTLTIGCRRQRTELSVGMEGNFGAPRRASLRSIPRSTINPRLGSGGHGQQTESSLLTEIIPLGFCNQYQKAQHLRLLFRTETTSAMKRPSNLPD